MRHDVRKLFQGWRFNPKLEYNETVSFDAGTDLLPAPTLLGRYCAGFCSAKLSGKSICTLPLELCGCSCRYTRLPRAHGRDSSCMLMTQASVQAGIPNLLSDALRSGR